MKIKIILNDKLKLKLFNNKRYQKKGKFNQRKTLKHQHNHCENKFSLKRLSLHLYYISNNI